LELKLKYTFDKLQVPLREIEPFHAVQRLFIRQAVKAIPLQARTGPEISRRLPDFMTIGA